MNDFRKIIGNKIVISLLLLTQNILCADSSDDALLAEYGSLEEPTTVVVAPPPGLSQTGAPLELDLPVFGTLKLFPYTDARTKQTGFRIPMPDAGMQLNLGPLVVTNGAFTMLNDTLSYGADATLFGVGVRVSLKDISPAEPQEKAAQPAQAKSATTSANKAPVGTAPAAQEPVKKESHSKITWGIDALPGQIPTLELIPGVKFLITSADVIFQKTKSTDTKSGAKSSTKKGGLTTLVLHTSIADKPIDFSVAVSNKGSDVSAAIPQMALTQLIPQAEGTPVDQAQLSELSLTIKNLTSREKPPKKKVVTFMAKADFSAVPGLEGSDTHAMILTGNYDSDTKIATLDATSKDVDLPGLGTIHDAKIGVVLGKDKKTAILQGKMDVDAGFGAITIEVNAEIAKKGIEFSAAIGNEISTGGVTVSNPQIHFSTITKKVSISGTANILGRSTSVTLVRDTQGKFALETSIAGSVKPFAAFNVPIISDFEVKDVKASIQQGKKGSSTALSGTVTFLGQQTGIVWATTADGKFAAQFDVPATIDMVALTKPLGPVGSMFDSISKVLDITLTKAKLTIANGAVALPADTNIIAPGFDIAGTVHVSGYLGSFLNQLGFRGGLDTDIFLPLTPTDINKVRVAINKSVNASLVGDIVKISSFAVSVQGSQPLPKIGLSLQSNVLGADVHLEGAVQADGFIDLDGSVNGDINLNKLGFPIDIDHPSFDLHLFEDTPIGLGIAGKFQLGNRTADVYADIDAKDPLNSVIQFSNLNTCMTDMYSFWVEMGKKGVGFVGLPNIKLSVPNLFCIKNGKGQWALKPVIKKNCTKDCTIIPGFMLEGDIDLGVPGVPSGHGHFEFSPSQITLQGGLNSKVDLGGFIKITDATGQKPPSLGMKLSVDDQRVWIDGIASIGGIIKEQTQAELTTSGIKVNVNSSYLGIDSKVTGQFPFAHPEQGTLTYELNDEKLVNFIKDDLSGYLTTAKNQIKKYAQDADNAINSAESNCGSIEVLSDLCKGPFEIAKGSVEVFKQTVNGSLTAIDQIATNIAKEFHLDFVSVQGNLAAFKGQGATVTVKFKFTILGKNVGPVSIDIPNPKDMATLAQKIAEYVYNNALKPVVNPLVDQVKSLLDKITGFTNDAIKAIQGAFEDIGKAANAVAQISVTFGNEIKDTSVKIGTTLKNIGETTGGAIQGAAVTAANQIASTATSVGTSIAKTAVSMGNSAATFAKETGDYTVEAANKVKDAFTTAGNQIAGGFQKVGDFFSHLF